MKSFQQYLDFCDNNIKNKQICNSFNKDNKFWYKQYINKVNFLPYSNYINYYNELFNEWKSKPSCDPVNKSTNTTIEECLIKNIRRGDLSKVKYLIEFENIDINKIDNILNEIINSDNLEIFKYLSNVFNFKINKKIFDKILNRAIDNLDLDIIEYLLKEHNKSYDSYILYRILDILYDRNTDIDYKKLNKLIVNYNWKLYLIEDLIKSLQLKNKEIFETLLKKRGLYDTDELYKIISSEFITVDIIKLIIEEYNLNIDNTFLYYISQSKNKEVIDFIHDLLKNYN